MTMKKCRLGLLLAFTVAALTACSSLGNDFLNPILPDDDGSTSQTAPPADATDSPAIDVVVEDDSLPPHEGMVRSRLTNEWVEQKVADTRPIAVMIPNEVAALPHYNLSEASIIYEANVEKRMTRMLAIYEDWQELGQIGNIRSLRSYYIYWAFEWDAFIVHVGGPFFIDNLLELPDTQNITETRGSDSAAFFRTTDRNKPHNVYTTGNRLLNIINKKGFSLEYRGLADDSHYQFASKAQPNTLEQYGSEAQNASYIDMSGCYPLTRCYFEFDESDGLYYRFQHLSGDSDGPHIDAVTGEQLSFKNILVQYAKYEDIGLDEGYITFQCHDNTMDGWYFTNGKGIHVTWEKDSDYGATRYYDDNGDEIFLNTGKTMVCIVEEGDAFSFR